jgi:DNA-binding PadR family transcriptional regulator
MASEMTQRRRLILAALLDGQWKTVRDLGIAGDPAHLAIALRQLAHEGLLESTNPDRFAGSYRITDAGRAALAGETT